MEKTLNAVLVTPEGIKNITVIDDLDSFYQTLECGCIDIVTRLINGKPYSIICDDNGKFKPNVPTILTFKDDDVVEYIVGRVLIVGETDEEDELTSLSEKDVEGVMGCYTSFIGMDDFHFVRATI